jgi:hypothetical protein
MPLAKLPGWALEATSEGATPGPEDADVERFAKMSVAERIALFFQLCDVTDSIVNGRPDRERLRAAEPLSAETEATLARLRREARARR